MTRKIKIFSNRTTFLEGCLALMEEKLKQQVAGLESGTMFAALYTHIPNIAMVAHQDYQMKVSTEKFPNVPT